MSSTTLTIPGGHPEWKKDSTRQYGYEGPSGELWEPAGPMHSWWMLRLRTSEHDVVTDAVGAEMVAAAVAQGGLAQCFRDGHIGGAPITERSGWQPEFYAGGLSVPGPATRAMLDGAAARRARIAAREAERAAMIAAAGITDADHHAYTIRLSGRRSKLLRVGNLVAYSREIESLGRITEIEEIQDDDNPNRWWTHVATEGVSIGGEFNVVGGTPIDISGWIEYMSSSAERKIRIMEASHRHTR